jgi:hypothetical protein
VKEEADRLGLTTKVRKSGDGRMWGGRPLSRGYIYKLLNNPLYIGRIAHKGKTYEGQHPPIINPDTWDAVRAKLAANARDRRSGNGARHPSPLAGKLFDEGDILLTPSHAVKSGRRYRYYISRQLIAGPMDRIDDQRASAWRLPAREIERIVSDAATGLLADRAALTDAARDAGLAAEQVPDLLRAVTRWRADVLDLIERVELSQEGIALTVDLALFTGGAGPLVRHEIPMRIKRRGVETRLVIEGATITSATTVDAALVKAVVRAHTWFDDLVAGQAKSLKAIAKAEKLSDQYVSRLMPLALLALEIVKAVLAGTQPVDLTADTLINHTDLPTSWVEQKALLGLC